MGLEEDCSLALAVVVVVVVVLCSSDKKKGISALWAFEFNAEFERNKGEVAATGGALPLTTKAVAVWGCASAAIRRKRRGREEEDVMFNKLDGLFDKERSKNNEIVMADT